MPPAPEIISLISDDETDDLPVRPLSSPSPAKRPRRAAQATDDSDDEVQFVSHVVTSPRSKKRKVLVDAADPTADVLVVEKAEPVPEPAADTPSSARAGAAPGDGDDLAVVSCNKGVVALEDYAHSRHMCTVKPLAADPLAHCPKCFCFVCDVPVASCPAWAAHAAAVDKPRWRSLRAKLRRANAPAAKRAPHNFFKRVRVQRRSLPSPPPPPPPPPALAPLALPSDGARAPADDASFATLVRGIIQPPCVAPAPVPVPQPVPELPPLQDITYRAPPDPSLRPFPSVSMNYHYRLPELRGPLPPINGARCPLPRPASPPPTTGVVQRHVLVPAPMNGPRVPAALAADGVRTRAAAAALSVAARRRDPPSPSSSSTPSDGAGDGADRPEALPQPPQQASPVAPRRSSRRRRNWRQPNEE